MCEIKKYYFVVVRKFFNWVVKALLLPPNLYAFVSHYQCFYNLKALLLLRSKYFNKKQWFWL